MATGFRTFVLAAALLLAPGAAQPSPWSDQTVPSSGPADSIGKPAAGCLAGAESLPFDGPGFQVIRISRIRYFGNPATVKFVEDLGRKAKAAGLADFYVGDMSLPRGGPMPNGHASHETGLDVDIWDNLDPKPVLAPAEREDSAAAFDAHGRWQSARRGTFQRAASDITSARRDRSACRSHLRQSGDQTRALSGRVQCRGRRSVVAASPPAVVWA